MAYELKTIFSANIKGLLNSIDSVKTSFNSLKTQSNGLKNIVGQDFKNMGGYAKVLDKTFAAATIGTATISAPLTLLGYKALQTAGQFEAAEQTVEFTLGKSKKIIDNFVTHNAASLGIAERDVYKFSNIYSNLLTTMTSDQETNANYTVKLLQASAVIASKTGRTMEDVMDRVRSGLLGNTEAIEDLGVNVNVALLQTTDAFKKVAGNTSWDKLSFQQQQQIRLLGILEQTSKKYGEEVGNNLALDLSKTSAIFKNVNTEASQFLATGLKPFLNFIGKMGSTLLMFVKYLNTLDDSTKQNVASFFLLVIAIPTVALVFATLLKAINSFNTIVKESIILQKIFSKEMVKGIYAPVFIVILGLELLSIAFGGLGNVVKNIGKVMQVAFLTAAASIIAIIGSIISAISMLIPSLKGVANGVMGYASTMYSTAQGLTNQIQTMGKTSKSTDTASKAVNSLTDAQNSNADSANKASKANKDLKDNLQSFDEINKLNTDETSNSGGVTVGPDVDLSGIDAGTFDNIGGQIDDQFSNLTDTIDKFKNKVKELAPVIGTIGVLLSLLGLGILINNLLKIKDILTVMGSLKFWTILGKIALVAIAAWSLYEAFKSIGEFKGLQDFEKTLTSILSAILFITVAVTALFGLIPGLIVGLVVAVTLLVVFLIKHWEEFKTGLIYILTSLGDWIVNKWTSLGDIIVDIFLWIGDKWKILGDGIVGVFLWIVQKWSELGGFIISIATGFWSWVVEKANNIGATFSSIWDRYKKWVFKRF